MEYLMTEHALEEVLHEAEEFKSDWEHTKVVDQMNVVFDELILSHIEKEAEAVRIEAVRIEAKRIEEERIKKLYHKDNERKVEIELKHNESNKQVSKRIFNQKHKIKSQIKFKFTKMKTVSYPKFIRRDMTFI